MPDPVRVDIIRNYVYLNDFKIRSRGIAFADTGSSEHLGSLFHRKVVDCRPPTVVKNFVKKC
jgi:hypothetical protein